MLTEKRYDVILKLLEKKKSVTVTELKGDFKYFGVHHKKRFEHT